ncbi:MAG: hypothetical protein DCF22_01595 [Leptolyngbya sp.]|nr:MAG: hypothetical protein DCF22_01595 [Leptolyngbya sp.]
MPKNQSWIDQISRVASPIAIAAIIGYGTWDLILQPLFKVDPLSNVCTARILSVSVNRLSLSPELAAEEPQLPEGLPIAVPAGEKRAIIVQVENPDRKPVLFTWKADRGKINPQGSSASNRAVYTAAKTLMNDPVTVLVQVQGCDVEERSLTIAVVPAMPTVPAIPLPASPP